MRGSLKCCYRVKIFPSSIYAYREKSAESASLFLPILFQIQSQLVLIAVTVITIRNSRICKSFKTSVLHSLCWYVSEIHPIDLERGEFGLFKIPFENTVVHITFSFGTLGGHWNAVIELRFSLKYLRIHSQLVLIAVAVITIRNSRICKSRSNFWLEYCYLSQDLIWITRSQYFIGHNCL